MTGIATIKNIKSSVINRVELQQTRLKRQVEEQRRNIYHRQGSRLVSHKGLGCANNYN